MKHLHLNNRRLIFKHLTLPFSYLIVLLIIHVSFVSGVMAQTSDDMSTHQQDTDGDGDPDITTISLNINTPNDKVRVYDQGDNMAWGSNWNEITDFKDDVWVFDTFGDDSAQIVMAFNQEEDNINASIYTDQDGDGDVNIQIESTNVNVLESPYPPLKAIVNGDWFLPNGDLNWNVRFQTDGPEISHVHNYELTDLWRPVHQFDGIPDYELEFLDRDLDGTPEYGIWRVISYTPASWGANRTWIWANLGNHKPSQPVDFLFWPYMSILSQIPAGHNYFDLPPFISVAISGSSIRFISFPGYPIESGFHVNTNQYFKNGQVNYADFEISQAYYDLANDLDGFPELHIRHRYFDSFDPYGWNLSSPLNEIRFSWNQTNLPELSWDYKLGLAGRQTISEIIALPDFSYNAVPYSELPAWVITNQWDYATFVARETVPYQSSEGIYVWAPIETMVDDDPTTLSRYLSGEIDTNLENAFQSISIGWRGELAAYIDDQPKLYFSSVDRKLHLSNADHGIWKINDSSEIRYLNLDNDPYFDQWQYYVDGDLLRQLNLVGHSLVYSGEDQVIIKQTKISPLLFEALPPINHDSWQELGKQLAAYDQGFSPGDFEILLNQFDGTALRIQNAQVRDFRVLANGYRFILTLSDDYRIEGADFVSLSGFLPGDYLVSYQGSYQIQPLSPSNLTLSIAPPAREMQSGLSSGVIIEASNTGLQDAVDLALIVETTSVEGIHKLFHKDVNLLSGDAFHTSISWQPFSSGESTLKARLEDPSGKILVAAQQTVQVHPSKFKILDLSPSSIRVEFVLFVLLTLAGTISLLVYKSRIYSGEDTL